MTLHRIRAACAVTAAAIVAVAGALLGDNVAPGWWTLTFAVACAAVVAVWGIACDEWVRLQQPTPEYYVAEGRAEVRRPSHYIYGYRSAA